MSLTLDALQQLWGEPATGPLAAPELGVAPQAIRTDSRLLQHGDLFIPLVGERFDGHAFLEPALKAGCRAVLAQRDRLTGSDAAALLALARSQAAALWWVADTQLAYQQLASLWRRQLAAPVVAVTGSAGKTTTRELIRSALATLGPVLASTGNENNDIGVPLTLLKAGPEHRAVVVEMGMRGLGEIARLSRCALPDVAVITNIGTAHIGRLGSREAIATAKCEITSALRPDGLVVIPAGDPLLEAALAAVWPGRVVRVALADDQLEPGTPLPDWQGRLEDDGLSLPSGERLPLPLPGRHNARNWLLALAVAQELGLAPDQLAPGSLELPGGRSRRFQLAGVMVLDETYNASPEAVLAALDLLAAEPLDPGQRRMAVLGTMLELGEHSVDLHRRVAARARQLGLDGLLDGLVIVDAQMVDAQAEGAAMEVAAQGLGLLRRVDSPEQAAEVLASWLQPGDRVLLKASRGVALERALPRLEALLSPAASAA